LVSLLLFGLSLAPFNLKYKLIAVFIFLAYLYYMFDFTKITEKILFL